MLDMSSSSPARGKAGRVCGSCEPVLRTGDVDGEPTARRTACGVNPKSFRDAPCDRSVRRRQQGLRGRDDRRTDRDDDERSEANLGSGRPTAAGRHERNQTFGGGETLGLVRLTGLDAGTHAGACQKAEHDE